MAENRPDPTAEASEADLIEQRTDPGAPEQTDEPEAVIPPVQTATTAADEADLLEQAMPLPSDQEDDYQYGR